MIRSNLTFNVLSVSKLNPKEHYSKHFHCYLDEGYRVGFSFDTTVCDEFVLSESISEYFGREDIGEFEFEPVTQHGCCLFLDNPPKIKTYSISIHSGY